MADLSSVEKTPNQPKYKKILAELRRAITSGQHKPGDRLPSEADLGARFGVSRLTVQRVLKELQIEDLVERKAGSGTYVKARQPREGHLFGLLIPGLGETEIFEPLCQGMAKAGRGGGHALLWGDTTHGSGGQQHQAMELCADYIGRGVSGVFFAPIEGIENKDTINLEILAVLEAAGVPVVLLDRCIHAYPQRSRFDLVGIDNRRAGCLITQHLLAQGAQAPVFLSKPFTAPTVEARIGGFQDALRAAGKAADRVVRIDPTDLQAVKRAIEAFQPDGFVCANDVTAANLMHSLDHLGVRVPEDIRITGIDDVRYAKLLRVPLTTLHQPCQEMGEVAIQVMLSRIAQPSMPARDILLDCGLVVRESCGERIRRSAA